MKPERLETYARRRQRLMARMGGGVAIVATHPAQYRNIHHEHPFRPDSNFLYLTGFPDPEACAIFAPEEPKERFTLFVRPRDPEMETWDGPRPGVAAVRRRYGADAVYSSDRFEEILESRLSKNGRLFHHVGVNRDLDDQVFGLMRDRRGLARKKKTAPRNLLDPTGLIQSLRSRKSPEEIARMARAAEITGEGHRAAMRSIRPGQKEFEVEAVLTYHFRKNGSSGHAYLPIVGGGMNATVLHYIENQSSLRRGQLVLIDAGAEFECYASDVTRTLPVGGTFTDDQRAIYEIVLEAEKAAVARVAPGVTFDDLQKTAVSVITRGLCRLGIVKGPAASAIRRGDYKKYYIHSLGHWLGLDTHDPCPYTDAKGKATKFEPGMVLTVEPGLYFPKSADVDPRWHGIGVRIEDDVVVTRSGHRVLTKSVPKEVDEIEAEMAHRD